MYLHGDGWRASVSVRLTWWISRIDMPGAALINGKIN